MPTNHRLCARSLDNMAAPPSARIHGTVTRPRLLLAHGGQQQAALHCRRTQGSDAHGATNANPAGLRRRQSFARPAARPRNHGSTAALEHLPVDVGTCLLTRPARRTTPSRLRLHLPWPSLARASACAPSSAAALARPEQKTVPGPSFAATLLRYHQVSVASSLH